MGKAKIKFISMAAVIVFMLCMLPAVTKPAMAEAMKFVAVKWFPEPLKGQTAVTAGDGNVYISESLYPQSAEVKEIRWHEDGSEKTGTFTFAAGKKYYAEIVLKAGKNQNDSTQCYFSANSSDIHFRWNDVDDNPDIVNLIVSDDHETLTMITREFEIADHFYVNFDLRGIGTENNVPQQTVQPGEYAAEPPKPRASGALFEGWYTSAECKPEERHAFTGSPITKDTMLYANWLQPASTDIRIQMKGDPLNPVIGEKIRPAEDFCAVEGDNYKVTGVFWYENGEEIKYPEVFKKGKSYTLKIEIEGTNGCLLPVDKEDIAYIHIDNKPELVDKESYFASYNLTEMTSSATIYSNVLQLKDAQGNADTPVEPLDPDKPEIKAGDVQTVGSQQYKVTKTVGVTGDGKVTLVKAKNAKKVTVPAAVKLSDGYTYQVTAVGAKAFKGKKIRTVTIGKNVSKLAKNAFSGSKATKLIVKTSLLKKSSVKGSLKKSKVKTVQVKVGKKSANKKVIKKYKKYFTRKNAGKKVKVK